MSTPEKQFSPGFYTPSEDQNPNVAVPPVFEPAYWHAQIEQQHGTISDEKITKSLGDAALKPELQEITERPTVEELPLDTAQFAAVNIYKSYN